MKGTLHGPLSDEADLLKSFLACETTQWPVTRRGDVSGRLALRDAGSVAGGHGVLAARQPARLPPPATCQSAAPGRAVGEPRAAWPHAVLRREVFIIPAVRRWELDP